MTKIEMIKFVRMFSGDANTIGLVEAKVIAEAWLDVNEGEIFTVKELIDFAKWSAKFITGKLVATNEGIRFPLPHILTREEITAIINENKKGE